MSLTICPGSTTHNEATVKKAHQCFYSPDDKERSWTLPGFYSCILESILLGCITARFGNCPAHNGKKLKTVVDVAQFIAQISLPTSTSPTFHTALRKCPFHPIIPFIPLSHQAEDT